jgi:chromate reductase, NAD(P)H dehydrogenase (quinone)
MQPRLLVFAGSIRDGSFSDKLANVAAMQLRELACEVQHISLSDFPMPLYDANSENKNGAPQEAIRLASLMNDHQAIVVVTPEYNQSLPPLLKNTIDWISRLKGEQAVRRKLFAILSSSTGQVGGARALSDLRRILGSAVSAVVLPDQMSLSNAAKAFDEEARLRGDKERQQLRTICEQLATEARRRGR